MKLQEKVRAEYFKYIRPLFIKDTCEICGNTENLELHNDEQLFSDQLIEVLKLTGLDNRDMSDTSNYTDDELKMISLMLLGYQVKNKYVTLCNVCHHDEHKKSEDFVNACIDGYYLSKYGISASEYIDEKLNKINFTMDKWYNENKYFPTLESRNEIIELLEVRKNGRLIKSLDYINKYLVSINCKYMFIDTNKQIDNIRYQHMWVVIKR